VTPPLNARSKVDMSDSIDLLRSSVPGIAWPAIPGPEAAQMLALQFQLERSQWLPAEVLRELQFRQLDELLRHAWATVPYYRERWAGCYDPREPLTPASFSRIPLLTRPELQGKFEALKSTAVPPAHGLVAESRTSGSTGQPVRVLKTVLVQLLWQSMLLREHQWFRRNLGGKLASIRKGVGKGEADGWGPATDTAFRAGRSATLPISADVDTQLQWLQEQQADYLLTYPSNLAELARISLARGIRFPRLREVRTFGEILTPETRELARRAWDAPVTDAYSSDEAGYLAIQCPESGLYHVMSEGAVVEILDERGAPCGPGEVGRVVVTPLHNFATPLVRYDMADYAEVGLPCACGRGLPALRRVVGRVRNMLVTADGKRYWPGLSTRRISDIAPVRQYQLVQKAYDLIEVRLVTATAFTAGQEEAVRRHLLSGLPVGLRLSFVYCASIPRSAGEKFEDFISELGRN
jgi:phenylacetate-CoA ligase